MKAEVYLVCVCFILACSSSGILAAQHEDINRELMDEQGDEWYTPNVLPVALDTRQIGDSMDLKFQVRHSAPGHVFNSLSLEQQGQTSVVQLSLREGESVPKISQTHFQIPNDWCDNHAHEAFFDFENSEGASSTVSVDVCHFYRVPSPRNPDNLGIEVEEENPHLSQQMKHETMKFPQFRTTPAESVMTVLPNTNITFEVEINFTQSLTFYISPIFYLPNRNTMLGSDIFLDLDRTGNALRIERHDLETITDIVDENLFHVQELIGSISDDSLLPNNDNNVSAQSAGETQTTGLRKKVQITINTASDHISGFVFLHAHDRFGWHRSDGAVISTSLTLPLIVKSTDTDHPFPPGNYVFREYGTFICYLDGTQRFSDMKGCRARCFVTGVDIASIRIYKSGVEDQPPQSRSLVRKYGGSAILDLGPPRDTIKGDYVCEVTGNDGQTDLKTLRVEISGHPIMDISKSAVSDQGSGVTTITCVALGDPAPEVIISDDQHRLDTVPDYNKQVRQTGYEVTVTLSVPTDHLRWPRFEVKCQATNDEGSSTTYFWLSEVIRDYYGQT